MRRAYTIALSPYIFTVEHSNEVLWFIQKSENEYFPD